MELRTLTLEKGGLDRFIALGFIMVMTYDTCFFCKVDNYTFFLFGKLPICIVFNLPSIPPKTEKFHEFLAFTWASPHSEDYHDWLKKSTMNESMVM